MNLQSVQKKESYKIDVSKLRDYFIMEDDVLIKARKHQMTALDVTYTTIQNGDNGILWHSTGSGKTIMQKLILQKTEGEKMRFVILDRTDLVHQTEYEFKKTFKDVLVIKTVKHLNAVLSSPSLYKGHIIISTLQKFAFLEKRDYNVKDALLLVDECHRSHTRGEGAGHDCMKRVFDNPSLIGLTGTPTYDSFLLFGGIINIYSFINGIQDSVVLPFKYTQTSDIKETEDVVDYFMNECDTNFKCMYVVRGVENVEECADILNSKLKHHGYKAMAMTYKTKNQKRLLQNFKDMKKYKFMVVDTKCLVGYNVPNMKYIFINKNMKSLNNFFQGISRTNRSFTGKEQGVIIDMCNNTKTFAKSLETYSSIDGFKKYLLECNKPKGNRGKKVSVEVNGEVFIGTVREITEKYPQFKSGGIYKALKSEKPYKKTYFYVVKNEDF